MEHLLVGEVYQVQSICVDLLSIEKSVQDAESTLAYYKGQKSLMEQALAEAGFKLLLNSEKPLASALVRIPAIAKDDRETTGTVAVYLPKKDGTR